MAFAQGAWILHAIDIAIKHRVHSDEAVKYQAMPTGLPRVPGHEIVGEVVAVPPTEQVWKVGDRVGSGWHGGHCHACKACSAGDFIMCEKENINGECTLIAPLHKKV